MSEYNFEEFTGYGSKVSRKISITGSMSFGIPPAFYQENQLSKYPYVSLFFDKNKKTIGILFKDNKDNGGFKIIGYGAGAREGATFVARSFFTHYKIDVGKYKGKYTPKKIHQEGVGDLYVIDLNENDQGDSAKIRTAM